MDTDLDFFDLLGVIKGRQLYDGHYWSCKMLGSVCVVVCIGSLLNIGAISINRYTFIVHNATYGKIYTKFSTAMMCIVVWMLAYLIDMPAHLRWSDHGFDMKTDKCLWDRTKNWYYTVFAIVVGIMFPLSVIVFFYSMIFRHINAAKKRLTANSKGDGTSLYAAMKQAKMMFIIFVCFSSCWMPYSLLLLLDRYDSYPVWAHLSCSMIAHMHASINFIIYGVSNKKIRAGYVRFIYRNLVCCVFRQDGDDSLDDGATVVQSTNQTKPEDQGGCCFRPRRSIVVHPEGETVYTLDGTIQKG
ncbi:hypothetical protein LSH36_453g02028 [Paralvinella palmiformis]|uniref:G-protein coupled receptors family 1 profile domain-containing protein n=1 Tax=Paralvinella palmiformis TaxID=53620 RepID=A0AAD9JBJ2_9ANNE|nr:hypothetical protein LSH36_453g02028 [Paralvinella palmiformis]